MEYRRRNGVIEQGRNGLWRTVPQSELTPEIREAAKATVVETGGNSHAVDGAHLEAIEADFVGDRYIPGSSPRKYNLNGEVVNSGEIAVYMHHKFGRTGTIRSYYKRLDTLLITRGFRLRAYAPRTQRGNGKGIGSMPLAIAAIEG